MRHRALLIALALMLLCAGSAAASDPGVTYDPNSSAGKQYAVPLDTARDVGGSPSQPVATVPAGTSQSGSPAQPDSALFGSGVQPVAHTGGKSGGNSSGHAGKKNDSAATPASGATPISPESVPETKTIRTVAADADASQLRTGVLVALLAAAAAAVGGFVARRGRQPVS